MGSPDRPRLFPRLLGMRVDRRQVLRVIEDLVPDSLWERVAPLLTVPAPRRHRFPGRKRRPRGLRALRDSRPGPGVFPGRVRQLQCARCDQGRLRQGRQPAAARHREHQGPHRSGLGKQGGREAARQVEGGGRLQGVRRTPPPPGRPAGRPWPTTRSTGPAATSARTPKTGTGRAPEPRRRMSLTQQGIAAVSRRVVSSGAVSDRGER